MLLGNGSAVFNGGAVFLGIISLRVVQRVVMVGCRWCWVADGGGVLLGNGSAGFHGGAVLLGNLIACGSTHCQRKFRRETSELRTVEKWCQRVSEE